jgi:hypothetical protein
MSRLDLSPNSERKSQLIGAALNSKKHLVDWSSNLPFWIQKIDGRLSVISERVELVQESVQVG